MIRRPTIGKLPVHGTLYRPLGQEQVETILDGKPLRRSIEQTVQDNRSYPTGLFIGPASGNGLAWVRRFDRVGGRLMEWHPFGESAHGPLVTVDPRLDGKYVRLKPRQEMIEQFGRERLEAWERRYLGTKTVDAFLKNPAILPRRAGENPFRPRAAGTCRCWTTAIRPDRTI